MIDYLVSGGWSRSGVADVSGSPLLPSRLLVVIYQAHGHVSRTVIHRGLQLSELLLNGFDICCANARGITVVCTD